MFWLGNHRQGKYCPQHSAEKLGDGPGVGAMLRLNTPVAGRDRNQEDEEQGLRPVVPWVP